MKDILLICMLLISNTIYPNNFKLNTEKCLKAYRAFRFSKIKYSNKSFKKIFVGQFSYPGSDKSSDVRAELTFHKNGRITGRYYQIPGRKYIKSLRGKIDSKGQLIIRAVLNEYGNYSYIFKGIYKDKQIYGAWSKAKGKRFFYFHVKEKLKSKSTIDIKTELDSINN